MRSLGEVLAELASSEMTDNQRRLVLELTAFATAGTSAPTAKSLANARYYQRRKTEKATESGLNKGLNQPLKTTENILIQSSLARVMDNPLEVVLAGKKKEKDSSLRDGFSAFWFAYPRRVGKGDARKAYPKALAKLSATGNADPPGALLAALATAKGAWDDPRYIPYPASWLNGERWDDEPETEGSTDWTGWAERQKARLEDADRNPSQVADHRTREPAPRRERGGLGSLRGELSVWSNGVERKASP